MQDSPAEAPRSSGSRWRWQDAPGKFENGHWYCSCDPPLKAVFPRVGKQGKNQGRSFYTCPKPREEQCGFFLWEEAAISLQRRATAAASSATTTPSKPPTGNGPGAVSPAAATPGRANPLTPTPARFNPPTATPGRFNPRPRGFNPGLREPGRSETPQSEAGSIMTTGDLLFSPSSTPFPGQGRNGRLFGTRSASRDPIMSSIEDSDGDGDEADRPSTTQQDTIMTTTPTNKRKRPATDQGGTESTDLSEVDSDDARELLEMTERVESASKEQQQRPSQERLGAPASDSPTTPSVGRTSTRVRRAGLVSLPTPKAKGIFGRSPATRSSFSGASEAGGNSFAGASEPRGDSFTGASESRNNSFTSASEIRNSFTGASNSGGNKRFKTIEGLAVPAAAAAAAAVTPSPARTRDALATTLGDNNAANNNNTNQPSSSSQSDSNPAATGTTPPDAAITTEILAVLARQPISAAARQDVRARLNLHAITDEGVLRGRAIARQGLRERNERIAELRAQVARLEREKQTRMELLHRAASEWETLPAEEGGGE